MPFEVGSTIDRYHLEALLGEGGMGRVFRAHDAKLGRRVALKILHAPGQGAAPNPDAASRMVREARAAAAFNHRSVVAVYDVGEIDGWPYIAMELVEGTLLRAFVGDPDVPLEQRVAWLLDVARGLAAAHRAGLVHRDVKPENVMIDREGAAKILDFGIARRADGDAVDPIARTSAANLPVVTAEGVIVGTLPYMAPEQVRGAMIDGRCDQFAWGAMAYELLAGKVPWRFTGGPQLVAEILEAKVTPLREVAPAVDPLVAAAVERALRPARDERFPTMDDLVAFVTGGSGPVVVPSSPASRVSIVSSGSGATSEPLAKTELAASGTVEPPARASSPRWPLVGLGVAVIAGAALLLAHPWSAPAPGSAPASASASASALASAPALTLTPGPLPEGRAARAAYSAALQSFRDGQSDEWRRNLEAVVAADPSFGAAYLWLGHIWLGEDDPRARGYFAKAQQHRATLGEVDAALLDALEPRFRDPPARGERLARMEKLGARYPRDATVQYMLGLAHLALYRYEDAGVAFDRALEVDPHFAFGYVNRIFIARSEGDVAKAEGLVDRCEEACPTTIDCRGERLELDSALGRCDAMVKEARAIVAREAASAGVLELEADAMAALGDPRATVIEMLQRANDTETEDRDYNTAQRRVEVDVYYGDLAAALRDSADAEATTTGHPDRNPVDILVERLGILSETGDKAALRALVPSVRGRIGAWEGGAGAAAGVDVRRYEVLAGLATRDDLRARREAFMKARQAARDRDGSKREPFWDWEAGYAATALDAKDAQEALELLAKLGPVPRGASLVPAALAHLGHAYVLAGRWADAVAPLRTATSACNALQWPREAILARFDLATALEHTDGAAAARPVYQSVVDRWGSARPRSVTGDAAKARLRSPP
jgi:serine/threonine-protein kinase